MTRPTLVIAGMKYGEGVRHKGHRLQASVRVMGELRYQSFPLGTPDATVQAWRERQRVRPLPSNCFAADVEKYLLTCQHLATKDERGRHMTWWVQQLGEATITASIEAPAISQALSALKAHGAADNTVRNRRVAIVHFFNRLFPERPNPARHAWCPPKDDPEPREIPHGLVRAILRTIRPGPNKARLLVILATGIPHAQLKQIQPHFLDWDRARVFVPKRLKGRKVPGRWVPLNRYARFAFRSMIRHDAFGPFSNSSMHKLWRRALQQLQIGLADGDRPITPYDLRHTFATAVYDQTGDLGAVGRLLGHKDAKMAVRYTTGAHGRVDRRAVTGMRLGRARRVDPIDDDVPEGVHDSTPPDARIDSWQRAGRELANGRKSGAKAAIQTEG